MGKDLFGDNGAEFSECRKYRYCLWRIWNRELPFVMFIGLNPSKADEADNDNTVSRVISFANKWGYGGVFMMNCFPYISTDPDKLNEFGNTALNDHWLYKIAAQCKEIIFAYGAFKIVKKKGRDKELIGMFPNAKALIINKDGSPRHPLYVKGNVVPVKFNLQR